MKSTGSTTNFRIDSARETRRFASSTAFWRDVRSSSSLTNSLSGISCFLTIWRQCWRPSGSRVIRAVMYERLSPITMHWLTKGWARSQSSKGAGVTFLPPEVMMMSFLRPVIVR